VDYPGSMDELGQWILCDAVTSGGLLASVAGDDAESLLRSLRDNGVDARIIGEVTDDHAGRIVVK